MIDIDAWFFLIRHDEQQERALSAFKDALTETRVEALTPLLDVHARYFNTEVSAYEGAEDFAAEDAWRFDRDFREAVDKIRGEG